MFSNGPTNEDEVPRFQFINQAVGRLCRHLRSIPCRKPAYILCNLPLFDSHFYLGAITPLSPLAGPLYHACCRHSILIRLLTRESERLVVGYLEWPDGAGFLQWQYLLIKRRVGRVIRRRGEVKAARGRKRSVLCLARYQCCGCY